MNNNDQQRKFSTWLEQPTYDISVLLPTRGRKEMLLNSVKSLIDTATDITRVQFMFGFDNDDKDSLEYAKQEVFSYMDDKGAKYLSLSFDPIGYERLHEYVNVLAGYSHAKWLFFWNDDATMQTQGWDDRIMAHDGEFAVLRVKTHKEHPYSIFPIVPCEWYRLLGHLSQHQLSDAWLSQVAYLLDIMKNVDIEVLHDRHDLTGNNQDDTFKRRVIFEGNEQDPRDFNYKTRRQQRIAEANKIAWYLKSRGHDTAWFEAVARGDQDPWEKMLSDEFDPNKQVKAYANAKNI